MKHILFTFLALFVFAPIASAFDISDMSEEEREAFRAEIREYLLENPEVIFEAVDILRAREEALAQQNAEAERQRDLELVAEYYDDLTQDGYSFVGGNPNGDVTVVEFLDYRCGYCRRAHSEVAELLEQDGNIRWVVKEFPILGPDSVSASRIAISTLRNMGDEAYLAMHDALMRFDGPINKNSIKRIAKTADLDPDPIIDGYDDQAVTDHLDKVFELGQILRVSGTPTFVIGETMVRGYIQPEQFEAIVDVVRRNTN